MKGAGRPPWSIHGGSTWADPEMPDFSDNSNPLGPPAGLVELVKEAAARETFLKFPANLAEETLSEYEGVPAVVFSGATEALIHAVVYLKPKRLVLLKPDYGDYARVAELLGLPYVYAKWPPLVESGDLVVFSNPNNPTGRYLPRDVVVDFARRAEAAGARVLVDESFADFCKCLSAAPDVPVVKSYGKFLASPGLRLGAALGFFPKELAPPWRVNSLVDYAVYKLGAERLRKHREDTVAYVSEEVPRVAGALSRCVSVSPTDVHFFIVYGQTPRGVKVRTLEDRGVRGYRVSIKSRALNDVLIEAVCGGV